MGTVRAGRAAGAGGGTAPARRRRAGEGAADSADGGGAGELADPETLAREICLRQLTARARTRAELARALARRGVPAEVADRVLSRFGEVGLIDDRAFAAAFVVTRHGTRGLARRALSVELRQRGVDQATASEALSGLDAGTEEATARGLVRRRLPATAGLDAEVRARRLVGMLARKGYSAELAYRVVREELATPDDTWDWPEPPPDIETE